MPKTGNRTGEKGGQLHNTNSLTHGAYRRLFDGRTRDAQEIIQTAENWIADLGGRDNLSAMELSLISDLAVIAWRARKLARVIVEQDQAVSESITKDFLRFHGSLVDGLSKLGLKRRAKEISLTELLQSATAQTGGQQK